MKLTKVYPNGEKILDEAGFFIDNPNYSQKGTQKSLITNQNNLVYYGDIYFWSDSSSSPQKIQVIMDTGSSWLWAPGSSCRGWPSGKSVDSGYFRNNGEGIKTIQYGSGGVSGNIVRSKVSLTSDPSKAVNNYKMIEITSATLPGLEESSWDGILGMLPASISGSELFVTQLYKQGIIKKNAFGISFTDTSSSSSITFGGYDPTLVPSESNFTYISLHSKYFWAPKIRHVIYSGKELSLDVDLAILDSGTSLVYLPENTFNDFMKAVGEGKRWGKLSGIYHACPWTSKLDYEPIYFLLGDYEYKMSPETYVVEMTQNRQKFWYFLVVASPSKKGSVLLGDAFLRNYYVYHDVDKKKIGMYGEHMVHIKQPLSLFYWILIILTAVLSIVILICVTWWCCWCRIEKKKQMVKEQLLEGEDLKSDSRIKEVNPILRKEDDYVNPVKRIPSWMLNKPGSSPQKREPSKIIAPKVK
jgi:saccharopepsin